MFQAISAVKMRAVLACLLWSASGCGNSQTKQLGFQGPHPKVPQSEAIDKFMGREGMTALYMNFDELPKSTAGTRSAVAEPKFLELFAAFQSEPIPKGFDSAQRKQDKAKFVETLEALMQGAKDKVADQELRQLAEPVRPAAEAFMRPTNY